MNAAFIGRFLMCITLLSTGFFSQDVFSEPPKDDFIDACVTAIEKGDLAAVKDCLARGMDVNAKTKTGTTPLMIACNCAQTDIVSCLLSAGADVNLTETLSQWTALLYAASSGNAKIVYMLIQSKADVFAEDKDGKSAIVEAAMSGHTDIVDLLLQAGVDIDLKASIGINPLLGAAHFGHEETVIYLLSRDAAVDAHDVNGVTPLFHAVLWDHPGIAKLLVNAGAVIAVDMEAMKGNSLLHIAASKGSAETVLLLLEAGADPDAENDLQLKPREVTTSADIISILDNASKIQQNRSERKITITRKSGIALGIGQPAWNVFFPSPWVVFDQFNNDNHFQAAGFKRTYILDEIQNVRAIPFSLVTIFPGKGAADFKEFSAEDFQKKKSDLGDMGYVFGRERADIVDEMTKLLSKKEIITYAYNYRIKAGNPEQISIQIYLRQARGVLKIQFEITTGIYDSMKREIKDILLSIK
ncbi:MAG: ankyrin repeat domain-containing protein [Spirochaetales bacterium]|nr:ankyrin repeat domain-containing protein [Spirochaetales bacterium]